MGKSAAEDKIGSVAVLVCDGTSARNVGSNSCKTYRQLLYKPFLVPHKGILDSPMDQMWNR